MHRPCSWAERNSMVEFLGAHDYNMFVYAPKNDPIHRKRWHEPYLPVELRRFAELIDRCARHGMEFVFGISPMAPEIDLRPYEDATLDAFMAARESMYWVAGDLFDHFIRRCLWAAAELAGDARR